MPEDGYTTIEFFMLEQSFSVHCLQFLGCFILPGVWFHARMKEFEGYVIVRSEAVQQISVLLEMKRTSTSV